MIEKYKGAFNPTYAAMMETMDDTVGLLLAKLAELKLVENTIVIFTSDNGGLHVLEFADGPSTHNTPFRAGNPNRAALSIRQTKAADQLFAAHRKPQTACW